MSSSVALRTEGNFVDAIYESMLAILLVNLEHNAMQGATFVQCPSLRKPLKNQDCDEIHTTKKDHYIHPAKMQSVVFYCSRHQ